MRDERLSLAFSEERRRHLLIVCALSILCLSQAAVAQSGRRQVKRESTSPPVSTEVKAEPTPTPATVKAETVASFIVGGDRLSTAFDVPSGYLDTAVYSCIDRLGKSRGITASAGGNMSRKDAIDKAKKQSDAHVVWLEFKADNDGPGRTIFVLEYSVFTPQTAKVKTFGRVYLDQARVGNGKVGVGIPPSISRRLPLDYQMKEGGRSIADRIMSSFHVDSPEQ
jgi:hypothetical protein